MPDTDLRAALARMRENVVDWKNEGVPGPWDDNLAVIDAVTAVLDLADESDRRVRANRKALEQNTFVMHHIPTADDYRRAVAEALGIEEDA